MALAWQYQLSECMVLLVLAGCCPLGPVSVLRLSCYYSCPSEAPPSTPQIHSIRITAALVTLLHYTSYEVVVDGLRPDLGMSIRMLQTVSVCLQTSHRAMKHCLYGKNGRLCLVSMRDRRQLFSSHLIKRCMLVCWCYACSLGHMTAALL